MPTVVWQMLPPWMWRRTALSQGTAAAFSSDCYGVTNRQLTVQIQEYEDYQEQQDADATRHLPLPVVTSEVGDLAQWSAMVAGDRRQTPPVLCCHCRVALYPASIPTQSWPALEFNPQTTCC
jgi:hypothetical protein